MVTRTKHSFEKGHTGRIRSRRGFRGRWLLQVEVSHKVMTFTDSLDEGKHPERYPLGTKWRDATTSDVAALVKMGVLSGLVE